MKNFSTLALTLLKFGSIMRIVRGDVYEKINFDFMVLGKYFNDCGRHCLLCVAR